MGQRHFNPWFSPWTFAGDLMIANMQIGAVLWCRLGAPQSGTETARMVNEKIAAESSGVFEAQKAALQLARDVTLGTVSPGRAASIPAELGAAAAKPALKTLKANTKRLTKRKTPRRS